MKSLAQVEPRTPISSLPYAISTPGSYYLTQNLAVSGGDAITISAKGVTLDLNGFTISSTAANANGTGILISGGVGRDITIRNGMIQGNVTENGGVFSGGGFANGIDFEFSTPRNVLVSAVSVRGVLRDGIDVGSEGSVVEACSVFVAGQLGIRAQVIRDSVARDCGWTAIFAVLAQNSFALSKGPETALLATSALNCFGYAFGTGIGIDAHKAENCHGLSSGGIGLNAVAALNCSGTSLGTGVDHDGIRGETVNASHGSSAAGRGIKAKTVSGSFGQSSSSGHGIDAVTVSGSYGTSQSGRGINGASIQTSAGLSTSSYGLFADQVANSHGSTTSGAAGIYGFVVSFSYGNNFNNTGPGIFSVNAIGCWGTGNPPVQATGGKFLGTP